MDIHIRAPLETDLPALARLMGDLGYPATPEQLRPRLARLEGVDDYATRVAVADGQVVGMMGLQRGWSYTHDEPFVRILALVVDERARAAAWARGWWRTRKRGRAGRAPMPCT